MLTYNDENKILANQFLENNFFYPYRKGQKKLELFISGKCSANCEYCYLKKHQHDLYPLTIDKEDIILNNLKKVLEWYTFNKFTCTIDIFSGSWLNTPLGEKIFNIFYDIFSAVEQKYRPSLISIPDNMQFLRSKEYTKIVEDNIKRFQELNIIIWFSASVDGYYCEYGRTPGDEEFYKSLQDFLTKYKYLPHPMISSNNIKDWIKNYQWWRNNFPTEITSNIMSLEVRDNSWTEESIQHLIQYCDFLVDYKFDKDFNGNKKEFLKYIFNLYPRLREPQACPPYNVIGLNFLSTFNGKDKILCSNNADTLHLRLGDLSVGLCHRLYYPEFELGKFNFDNGFEGYTFNPTNVSLLIAYKKLNKTCLPYCENCMFNGVCIGHCHGASYEDLGNPMVPDLEVCNMYKSKISFLIYKYYTLNLFNEDMLEYLESILEKHEYNYLIDLISNVLSNMNVNFKEQYNE